MGNLSARATFWDVIFSTANSDFLLRTCLRSLTAPVAHRKLGKGGRCVGGISIRAFYTARPKAGKSELIVANAEFR